MELPINKLNVIFSRRIIIFGGEYGRCKSLSLAALTFFEIIHTQKKIVVSNMPLKYNIFNNVEIKPLIQTAQFDLNNMQNIQRSIMIHDELFNDLLARNFMQESNKFIPNMAVGFRKCDINYRGSLQYFDTMERLLGLMLEMIIIPSFKNTYTDDSDEDRNIRLSKKDFIVIWKCIDRKKDKIFDLEINLYPFLNMYNTNYIPYKLIIDHESYLKKMQKNKRTYYNELIEELPSEIINSTNHFNEGLEKIL